MYGPVPFRRLPKQDDYVVIRLAERWNRAREAHAKWAETAKVCYDFVEGRQWTPEQIAALAKQGRAGLTFNIIRPYVRLVLGYQGNNETDMVARPADDGVASQQVAEAISELFKKLAEINSLPDDVDPQVFMDGIVCGRGLYDTRLSWEANDFGEMRTTASDPFSTYLDPDGQTYDINGGHGSRGCQFLIEARDVSIEEIEFTYGKQAATLVAPFTRGQTPQAPITSVIASEEEITPVRSFGQREDSHLDYWDHFTGLMGDFVDPQRRTIKLLDVQHTIIQTKPVMIDLETGDREPVPDHWDRTKIEKAIYYAQTIGNPITVAMRPVRRVRWTTMVGDLLVHDDWSPYETFTKTGFFPYFRRGITQGMVEDMLDPQREKNKRRMAQIEMASRLANGGWKVPKLSLDPRNMDTLKRMGSVPGIVIEYEKEKGEPQEIRPFEGGGAHDRLEQKADEDERRISGINEAALGELDKVTSGRALEARQRQAVIGISPYMKNFARTRKNLGEKWLEVAQNHYTEERIYRMIADNGQESKLVINGQLVDPVTGAVQRINDITVGKYTVAVDERPLAATFANAQFEEALLILEKMGAVGQAVLGIRPDLLVEMSSLPNKEEWLEALRQAVGMAAAAPPPAPGGGKPPGGQKAVGAPEDRGGSLVQGTQAGGKVVTLPTTGPQRATV